MLSSTKSQTPSCTIPDPFNGIIEPMNVIEVARRVAHCAETQFVCLGLIIHGLCGVVALGGVTHCLAQRRQLGLLHSGSRDIASIQHVEDGALQRAMRGPRDGQHSPDGLRDLHAHVVGVDGPPVGG
eukprot:scaffold1_cov402-Prasinococcus_capsulatus_cf.AAC.23